MIRLRALWRALVMGLWFLPSVMVLGAIALAVALVEAEALVGADLGERFPRLFGAGAEGSRELLSAIAGSMITVAGVVFSVTLVALSLAASQYSPRVLRTFMGDRPTQAVLGVFVGVFAYCLVVLRTVRGGDDGAFVPSLAVLGAIALAFVAIGFLVFFIHHLAHSIEASSILARVTAATLHAVESLFPEDLGESGDPRRSGELEQGPWMPVPAQSSGYVVNVDEDGLLRHARESGRVLRMECAVGDFAVRGQPIVSLHGARAVDEEAARAVNALFGIDELRTVEQDAAFGVQQITDIALKALSPGINDPSTAIMCIDRLAEILARLARRRVAAPYRRDAEGAVRVIALGPTFEQLLSLALEPVRRAARGDPVVLDRLQWCVERIRAATRDPQRLEVLAAKERLIRAGSG